MKLIPLTKGKYATVDDQDYSDLSRYRWVLAGGYPSRYEPGVNKPIQMGRHLLHPKENEFASYENGDRLDNRRSNLRITNPQTNTWTSRLRVTNKSGYRGVSWHRTLGKWESKIYCDGTRHFIGYFDTAVDAAKAYNKRAVDIRGPHTFLNDVY